MSRETLLLLRTLLANQTLSVGAEDFATTSRSVATALEELDAELAKPADPPA